jgi:hypothetical protein
MVPKRSILLLSGIPATGKSTFARYLAREHGFAHYDLECYPRGWPHSEFKQVWDADRKQFVASLRNAHDRVAIDWGFPVHCLPWVAELQSCGVQLIWFDGDVGRARHAFIQRGGISITDFDQQVSAIRKARFPASLNCVVAPALSADGTFLSCARIERIVFPQGEK